MASGTPGAGHRGVGEHAVHPLGLGARRADWPLPHRHRARRVHPAAGRGVASDSRSSRRASHGSSHRRRIRSPSGDATNRGSLVSHQSAASALETTGITWLDAARAWLARFPLSIIQLAGRIGVGATFFKAGLLKYQSWEFTVRLFQEEYRVPLLDPAVAARIAMVQELTIPILLFLGLATRIATLPLLGMIAVIQTFVYPNAYNEHLVWAAILVLLLTRGPGVFSVDYLIGQYAKKRSRRRQIE